MVEKINTAIEKNQVSSSEEEELVREKISRILTKLMQRNPFFSSLVLKLLFQVSREVPTAGVSSSGKCFLNPDFFKNLSNNDALFVVVHEVLHPALGIFSRMRSMDKYICNIAHDYVINLILEESGFEFSKTSSNISPLLNFKYKNWSFEEVYQDIIDNKSNLQKISCLLDKDAILGEELDKDGRDGGIGEDFSSQEDKKNENFWKEALLQARQEAIMVGDKWGVLPLGLRRLVEEILFPQLSWKEYLSRFLGDYGFRDIYSFSKPNRRSQSVGIYLPSLKRSKPKIFVVLDTSGSISGEDLGDFLAEVSGIIEELSLPTRVLGCDAEVHFDLDNVSEIEEVVKVLAGGGGSDFGPVFQKILEEGDFGSPIILFTDGEISVPKDAPANPVMWVLKNEKCKSPASYGEVIYLKR